MSYSWPKEGKLHPMYDYIECERPGAPVGNAVIVAKTKMAHGYVCVGAVDIHNKRSIRLYEGVPRLYEDCPFKIGDLYRISYEPVSTRSFPHCNEDVCVTKYAEAGERVTNLNGFMWEMLNFAGGGVPYIHGGLLENAFGGCLRTEENGGAAFIDEAAVPPYSTCFWVADRDLQQRTVFGKLKMCYENGSRYGVQAPWVGFEDAPETIKAGTLVRLSLAHWWSPTEDAPLRCYLQLSGVY